MDTTEMAFGLILNAGDARNYALQAGEQASCSQFDEARESIAQARQSLKDAHQVQTDLIQAEARGEKNEFGLIMVHAQDHLTMAMMAIDHAEDMLRLYEKLDKLERKCEVLA